MSSTSAKIGKELSSTKWNSAETESGAVPQTAAPAASGSWIVGKWTDCLGLIFSPLIALALGAIVYHCPWARVGVTIGSYTNELSDLLIGALIFGHLGIVFFRSHGNSKIFGLHPVRFVVVPIALFAGMLLVPWMAVAVAVIAVIWDVYHSCMQTFGIGRIYDARAGNDPTMGRRLDRGLNLLLYAGPILAGATLMLHINMLQDHTAGSTVSMFFADLPLYAIRHREIFLFAVLAVAIPYLALYLGFYWRLSRQGYRVSWKKVALLVSTAVCSIWTWGYNSFGEAFLIMNLFHAVQYFVLVWWAEKRNLQCLLGLEGKAWGRGLALALFLVAGLGFGLWAEITPDSNDVGFALVMVVSIMHFWYDGFIWSVRKKEV